LILVEQVHATDGRVLALDPGERRIGIAVSNSQRSMAFPRDALLAGDGSLDALVRLIEEEEIVQVVIGLPKHLNGKEGSAAGKARALGRDLAARLEGQGVGVSLHDERLTTVSAQQSLRASGSTTKDQRSKVDSAAAAVLLESWLACQ
jgi:putative holliday junction resolvase